MLGFFGLYLIEFSTLRLKYAIFNTKFSKKFMSKLE